MPKVTLELSERLYRELEEEARRKGVSVEDVVTERLVGKRRAEAMEMWIEKVKGTITDFTTDEIMSLTRE